MSCVANIVDESFIDLQKTITMLERSTLEESIQHLLSTNFAQTEDGVYNLVSCFFVGGEYYPDSIPLIVEIIVRLLSFWKENEATKEFPSLFKQYYIEHVFHRFSFRKAFLSITFFLFHIYKSRVLELKEIVEHVDRIFFAAFKQTRSLESKSSLSPLYITCFLSFFGPFLEREFPEFFEKCNTFLSPENAPQCYSVDCIEFSFFEEYKHFRENEWNLWQSELGPHSQCVTVFDAIRQDNVEMLQFLSTQHGFDPNMRARPSILEPSLFIMNSMEPTLPTLLQLSAYHRSLNCFKFLLLNGAKMDDHDAKNRTVVHYALAGGNCEIIRHVQQSMEISKGMIAIPIEFHYFNVFEWLFLSHFNTTKDMPLEEKEAVMESCAALLRTAAVVNNVEVLRYVLQKEVDVNAVDEFRWTALHYAADNGHYMTVKILLQVKGILFNPQCLNGWSPLHRAAMMGHFRVVSLLLRNPNVDVNLRNYSGVCFTFIEPLYTALLEMVTSSVYKNFFDIRI